MKLQTERIQQLLPHAGSMCLLQQVLDWSAESIVCRTLTHLAADNPLRGPRGLGSANAIEYASQAMALHAGLVQVELLGNVSRGSDQHGVIASVRRIRMRVAYLDSLPGDLIVKAWLVSGDNKSAQYHFEVCSEGVTQVSGRATVVLIMNSAGDQRVTH